MDADNPQPLRISNDFLAYQYEVLGILDYMGSADVTEICINRPGEVYLGVGPEQQRYPRAEEPAKRAVMIEARAGRRGTCPDPR